jgi:hypothetical protein
MPTKTKVPLAVINKIKKLAQITQELYQGKHFNITRLTTLKSLCENPDIASCFVFYLAQRTQEKMETKEEPTYIQPEKWLQHKELVEKAVLKMREYLDSKTKEDEESLKHLLYELKQLQNQYENQSWGPVRIIESSDTLVVEKALECILSPKNFSFWAYHVGREYAERYNSHYGTGLIPESAPLMEDIVIFWFQYYGI